MGNKKRSPDSDLPADLRRLDLLIRKALESPAVREDVADALRERTGGSEPATRQKRPARWTSATRKKRASSTPAS